MSTAIRIFLLFLFFGGLQAFAIDLDGDGMSDVWESEFSAKLLQPQADQDGDGFTNLQESKIGSDPFDPADNYSVTHGVTRSGDAAIVWTPRPGKIYTPRLKATVNGAWSGTGFQIGGGPGEMKLALCNGAVVGAENAVMREIWTPLGGVSIDRIDEDRTPSMRVFQPSLEIGPNSGEFYGARTSGFITPTTSGAYRFWLAARDDAEFRLGPGADEAETVIASIEGIDVNPDDYQADPAQQSGFIFLTKGVPQAFEILHKGGGGIDHLSVIWQGPGMPAPVPVPSSVLSASLPPPVPVVIGGGPRLFFAQLGVEDIDTDGDRVDDWEELIAGTSPFDPESGTRNLALPVSDYLTVGNQYDLFDIVTASFRRNGAAVSSAREGTTGIVISVIRDYPSTVPIMIPFNNIGSATPGTDYTTPAAEITIPAGQTTATLPVTIVQDGTAEAPETLQLVIQSGLQNQNITLTITD